MIDPDAKALLQLIEQRGLPALHELPPAIGDLDTHDTLCRELANGSGCALLSVDCRLGPEHRFPAAVDDAIAATRWVHDHAAGVASTYVCFERQIHGFITMGQVIAEAHSALSLCAAELKRALHTRG
jgi:acetyl esterase/lipase